MARRKARPTQLIGIAIIIAVCLFAPPQGLCRLNLPEAEGGATIEGSDNAALLDFFGRPGKGPPAVPTREVARILLAAVPEAYREGCADVVAHWGNDARGTERLSVSVLHVEGGRGDGPFRAFLAYDCSSASPGYGRLRDERLAAITVGRGASRLSMMPDGADRADSPELTRIRREKDIHIGGRSVVGFAFERTSASPGSSSTLARQEWVNFYLLGDGAIKRAGSILKARETEAEGGAKSVYSAAVILKKDMRGNVVGILSPYTVTRDGLRTEKGMVRYGWDAEKQEFVRQ